MYSVNNIRIDNKNNNHFFSPMKVLATVKLLIMKMKFNFTIIIVKN